MTPLIVLATLGLAALLVLWPRTAYAHCDTLDGPAVAAGRHALDSGDLNQALVWVGPEAETELRDVFATALRVRVLGKEAAELADRLFLETLVRLHRAGEGAGFDGLKPAGSTDPVVAAADTAIQTGSIDPLTGLIPDDRLPELGRRLRTALALKHYSTADITAGRRYLAAYVGFVRYAEGEDHGHTAARHEHVHH